jgi:hypothetical protein
MRMWIIMREEKEFDFEENLDFPVLRQFDRSSFRFLHPYAFRYVKYLILNSH